MQKLRKNNTELQSSEFLPSNTNFYTKQSNNNIHNQKNKINQNEKL